MLQATIKMLLTFRVSLVLVLAEPKLLCFPLPFQATVEEALWFSARLRLAKEINNQAMWAFIYEVGIWCAPHIQRQEPF